MSNIPVAYGQGSIQQTRSDLLPMPVVGGRGQLAGSVGTLYTAPTIATPLGSIARTLLTGIWLNNTDTSARTITLYLVESGGSAADNRAILKDFSLAAKTPQLYVLGATGIPLDQGETIQGLADVASKVTYRLSIIQL